MTFFSANRKWRIISLIIVFGVITVMGFYDVISASIFKSDISKAYENHENDITIMAGSEYHDKQNVYGSVLYLYGCFCEETTTTKTYGVETSSSVTGSYYLMPIVSDNEDDEKYITVLVKNKNSVKMMDAITDDTYDYLNDEEVEWHDFFITGKVKPLESDVRSYLIDWFKANEWFDSYDTSTMNQYIVPYEIEEYDPDARIKSGLIMSAIGLGALVIIAIIFIVSSRKPINNSPIYQPPAMENSPYNMPVYPKAEQPAPAVSSFEQQPIQPVQPAVQNVSPEPLQSSPDASESIDMNDIDTSALNMDSLDNNCDDYDSEFADDNLFGIESSDIDIDSLDNTENSNSNSSDSNFDTI